MVFCAFVAFANAGSIFAPAGYAVNPTLYSAPISYSAPAITSQSSNIYRSAGNLGQISTYSKTIDTPFSSVRKADVRISNPGYRVATPTLAYAAPAAYTSYSAPAAYAAHAPLLGVAYSAAPAVAHVTFDSGVAHYAF